MTALHSTRQSMPVLGTAARIIDVLDALLELGHGDVTMFASDGPHRLTVRYRDGVGTLVVVHFGDDHGARQMIGKVAL